MSVIKVYLFTFLIVLVMTSCSTIPRPIEENVTYPYTFTTVGYLEKYGRFGFDHIANLTVDKDKIVFSDADVNLVIRFETIEDITYKRIFFTDPNKFVIISYRDGNLQKKAMFTAFRYLGWVGGTSEIHDVIQLSYKRYKAEHTPSR